MTGPKTANNTLRRDDFSTAWIWRCNPDSSLAAAGLRVLLRRDVPYEKSLTLLRWPPAQDMQPPKT